MLEMTCGLVFNKDKTEIAMIRKKRPIWQVDKLNGVGGKLEGGETADQCMAREAFEEMGIEDAKWFLLAKLDGDDFAVYFYAAFGVDFDPLQAKTDEEIEFVNISGIFDTETTTYHEIMPNIKTMIGLALDKSSGFKTSDQWIFV